MLHFFLFLCAVLWNIFMFSKQALWGMDSKIVRDINSGNQAHPPYFMVAMVPWASSVTIYLHNCRLQGCMKIAVLWTKWQNQWQFRQFKWSNQPQLKHKLIFKLYLFKLKLSTVMKWSISYGLFTFVNKCLNQTLRIQMFLNSQKTYNNKQCLQILVLSVSLSQICPRSVNVVQSFTSNK